MSTLFSVRSQLANKIHSLRTLTNSSSSTFQTKPYKLHKLDTGPSTDVSCNRENALHYFRQMLTVRRLEASANALYKEKLVRGFCHLYTGQEAVCVGMENAIRKSDAVISGYRIHGWTYVRGASLNSVLAELTGRQSGCSRGKGGSMHMYHDNFFGGNGIVGAQMPLGAGIALAQKYLKKGEITLALGGDGAANQGQAFEAYNMAKLWSLPVVFITENNGYGMGTSTERSSASPDFYTRGDYIPGICVDGMDVLAVLEATKFLVDKCRQGEGPFVMEVSTYRYHGHSVSDPGTSYRTREEIQEVRQTRDPITLFRSKIIDAQLVTTEELKTIEMEVKNEVDESVKYAMSDPALDEIELYNDVCVQNIAAPIRGVTPFTENIPHICLSKEKRDSH